MTTRSKSARSGAAFFDLDRTLLAGASGEVFSAAMKQAGLVNRSIPGESLLFRLFNTIGETLPSMALARQAVTLAKGKPRASVQAAASTAAERLLEMVQPLAAPLFDEHRAAGRPVVMATTTPYDMVKPLADLLRLDGVVATEYGVSDDGTYDGTLRGPFVWSAGKLAAVRTWAEEHDIDLAESYAYSDSVYDTPLLAAVGHPFVVNPDARMAVMAAARRWPTLDLSAGGNGMAKIPVVNMEIQRLALSFTHPLFFPYAKFDIDGVENIPKSGPAIIVGNHRSYFDPMAMAVTIARTDRTVRFLGKKEVFDAPIVGQIAAAMGGIRVDRGTGSDEPLKAACEALEAGDMVAMMPQGTIPPRKGLLRPEAEGALGCRATGGNDRRAGDSHRIVGDREGVAAVCTSPQRAQHRRPSARHRSRRSCGGVEVPDPRRRYEADHESADGSVAAGEPSQARPDGRGVGRRTAAWLQGRCRHGEEAPPRRRLTRSCLRSIADGIGPAGPDRGGDQCVAVLQPSLYSRSHR